MAGDTTITIQLELGPESRALLSAIHDALLARPQPTGARLELVPDDTPPAPAVAMRDRDPSGNILRWLAAQPGGAVDSKSGYATRPLAEAVGKRLTNVTHVLARLEADGLVEREVGNRKTYRIAITEDGLEHIGAHRRARVVPTVPREKPAASAPTKPTGPPAQIPDLGPIGPLGHVDQDIARDGAAIAATQSGAS